MSKKLDVRQILVTKPILDEIKKKKKNPSFLSQFTLQKGHQGFPLTRMKTMKKKIVETNPILVKATPYGKTINSSKKRLYELIDGRHRFAKAVKMGKKTIKVKIV